MADTNKEKSEKKKAIYKYGEHELDLNTYIHNLGTNLNTYLDKVKKDWTEDQRNEFTAAFDNYLGGLKEQLNTGVERFSTNNYGSITDSQGILSSTDDDGIDSDGSEYYYNDKGERITTKEYDALKKRKQKNYKTFSANKEVASYFKLIGEKIKNSKPKEAEPTTKGFDLNPHGFVQFHANKYNPNGGVWDGSAIMDLDAYDETTKKRDTKQRMASLKATGYEYLDQLDPSLDFSKTRWKTRDEYVKFAKSLFDRLDDGVSAQDYLDFGQIGVGRNFLEPYTTTEKEILTPQEEASAEAKAQFAADAQKKKEQEEKYKAMMQEKFNIYKSNAGEWDEYNPYDLGSLTYWDPTNGFNQAAFDASFNIKDNPEYYDSKGNLDKAKFDNYVNNYLTGNNVFSPEGRRALSAIIGAGKYETIAAGPYKGMYYIPQVSDRTTNMGLVYNPTTGTLQRVFIGDLPSQAERIKREWMEAEGIINRQDRYKLYKEGGSIDMMQLGGGFNMGSWMDENREKALKERAKKEGRTVEQQKAGERKTNSDAKDPSNPDAEWKATDTARVAASIADIGSMISSFLPGAGTIVGAGLGVGSSLTTFGADWAEDGLDWGDVKNLGANLGLDVLGLIPGGGAASKGVKIAKTLGKYASRAMAAVAAYQGLSNSNNIIASINKMTTDPTNLTVDDWRNISQGFGLLTGGVAAGTRKVKKTIAEADMKAKANGAIAVEMKDKQGNTKMVAFDGNDAQAIRKAQQSGNLEELRKVTVGKYEQFRDWDLTTTGNTGWRSVKGDEGWQMPWGAKEGKARIFDMYGDKNGNLFTKGGNWQADVKVGKPIDSATELQTATVDKAVADNKKALIDKLKSISERKAKQVTNMSDKITTTDKAFTTEITQKRNDLNAANTSGDPTQITNATNALNEALGRQQDWQTRRARIQQAINDIKAGKIKAYDQWKADNLRGQGADAVLVVNSNPYNRPAAELAFEQILKDLNLKPNYFKYERGGRFNNVRRFLDGGDLKNVINPGDWYVHMFNSDEMKKWLSTFNAQDPNSIKQFNDLQDSWAVNKKNTGYTGQYAVRDKTGGVGTRQKQWNDITGTNPIFERIEGLKRHGGTKDNPEGGYVDNVFGAQEFFRHGGTEDSWKDNQEELQATIKAFADRGLDYYLDNNGMYKLRVLPVETPPEVPAKVSPTTSEVPNPTVTETMKEQSEEDPENNTFSMSDLVNDIFNNPTLSFGLPRALYSDMINRKMTNIMKDAEIPIYRDWAQHKDIVESDLGEENRGKQSKAALNNMTAQAITPDADKYMAARMQGMVQGLTFENEAMRRSDLAHKESKMRDIEHDYQDAVVATDTANINTAAGISTLANLGKHEAAYLSSKHKIWDTLGKQFEYEKRLEIEENKAGQDALIRSDIHDSVMTRILTEGETLGFSTEQIEALKLLKSGKTVSQLSESQQQALAEAKDIISELETAEWAKYKKLKRFDAARQLVKKESNPEDEIVATDPVTGKKLKNGGKIAVAGIRAKTADAERFQKLILESMKRHDKALDRLSKSMVNYVKDIMK